MAFFAPNANAYRRFTPNLFVPVNRRWGINNRSTGLRIPAGEDAAAELIQEIDNKFLMTKDAARASASPMLLATLDLMALRPRDDDGTGQASEIDVW